MRYLQRHRRWHAQCRVDRTRPAVDNGTMTTTGRDKLARAVQSLRAELNLTQAEFGERGGVTERTVQRVEKSESVSPRTLGAIDRAAGWEPGTAQRVIEGKPAPVIRSRAKTVPANKDTASDTASLDDTSVFSVRPTDFNEEVIEKGALMLYAAESRGDEAYRAAFDFLCEEITEELAFQALKRAAQMSIQRSRGAAG